MSPEPSDGPAREWTVAYDSEREELDALRKLWATAVKLGCVTQEPCTSDHEDGDDGCCEGEGWYWKFHTPKGGGRSC